MGEELQEPIDVDLSAVDAKLKNVQEEQAEASSKLDATLDRIEGAEDKITTLDKLEERLSTRIKRISKKLFKIGASFAVAELIGEFTEDSEIVRPITGIAAATVTGAAFGGGPGAILAGITSTLVQIIHAVKSQVKRTNEIERKLEEEKQKRLESEFKLKAEIFKRDQDLKEKFFEASRKAYEETRELIHQTRNFEAKRQLGRTG